MGSCVGTVGQQINPLDLLEDALMYGELSTHAARVWRTIQYDDVDLIPVSVGKFRAVEVSVGYEENWDC